MSANADLITVGTYTTKETPNSQFCMYGSECEKIIFLAIWCVCGGGGGFPAILSPISMIMSNKETI